MKLKKISALKKGFTLIELLVVMGILAILIAVVTVSINPLQKFATAKDTQRKADISRILTAIYQYAAANNGNIPTEITTTPTNLGSGVGLVDLTASLVPTYIEAIPVDPTTGTASDTKYVLFKNGTRITASASAESTTGYITLTQ